MATRVPLSVAIITKNEEANLPLCLKSVSFAEQIVIVDSDSTDNTVKVAREFGCHVFIEPWLGFGPQKQLAIDRCHNDWVLVLDADERIPAETADVIANIVLSATSPSAGFSFPRKNYFQGRWIRHMGWWPDRVVRLFLKNHGKMTRTRVHEAVEIAGAVQDLDVPILHYTESDLSHVVVKMNHYSTLAAQEAYEQGARCSIWSAVFRAKLTFFHDYLIRLGFLDGVQGLTLSLTDSMNKFLKYSKLAELTRQRGMTIEKQ